MEENQNNNQANNQFNNANNQFNTQASNQFNNANNQFNTQANNQFNNANNQFNNQANNQYSNLNNNQFNNQPNNQYNNNFNTDAIKNETVETMKQVKDSIKNVNLKNDTKEATGFVKGMFKNPFQKIKEIAEDKSNKYLKIAIIFMAIWIIAEFVRLWWRYYSPLNHILEIVKATIEPILIVLILSIIVYAMNKKEKKSLSSIMSAITIAKIPVIFAAIVDLVDIVSDDAYKLTAPISKLASIVSTILIYFTIKEIMKEEDNSKFLKTFVIVEAIYCLAYFILSFLGIYI